MWRLMLLKPSVWTIIVGSLLLVACDPEVDKALPSAAQAPQSVWLHDDQHVDPYAYLGDTEDPRTIRYLAAEREYAREKVAEWASDRLQLERELNARLPVERRSASVVIEGWRYYREIAAGAQYPSYYRRRTEADEPQLLLDTQAAAAGSPFYTLGGFAVADDDSFIAYTENRSGSQHYVLNVTRLLGRGEILHSIAEVGPTLAWWQGKLVYTNLAQHQVEMLDIGTGERELLYQESAGDSMLAVRLAADRSRLLIESLSPAQTHLLQVDAAGQVSSIAAPSAGHHYRVRMLDDHIYVLTNFRNPDFELARAQPGESNPATWRTLASGPGSIQDFAVSASDLVIKHRSQGQDLISLVDKVTGATQTIIRAEPAEQLTLIALHENLLSFEREGLLQPSRRYQYDLENELALPGGTEGVASEVATVTERKMPASDGIDVPVTILLPVQATSGPVPMLVTAYGAYGISFPFSYDPALRLLLERGVGVAVVHVRGGGELGAAWHTAGSGKNKQRGVSDLIEASRFLVREGLAEAGMLAVRGVSAGATLAAAAINQAPGLYRTAVLKVPYLDLVNSLLDVDQLLTASDRVEWGNPEEESDYRQLKALSPYDNIAAAPYPDTLLLAARQDERVSYTEALKWLARLRAMDSTALKLLYLEDAAGHGGSSDQYQRRRRDSLEHVFILHMLDVPITR